jgi:hypothetical protein
MSGPNRYISAGAQNCWWGRVHTNGYFIGPSGSTANGASEGMRQILGIKSANPGPVEPEAVDITGDDITLGAIDFGPNEVPKYVMETAAFDLDTQAKLQSTLVETLGDIRIGVLQPNDPEYVDIVQILQAKTKSKDVGTDGLKAWSGYIIPVANAVPLGRGEFNERTPAVDRYKVTLQVASRNPWGVTITAANAGTTGAPMRPFTADNPITMHYWIGDGAASTVILDKTPVSLAKIIVHEGNGQLLTATTHYTLSGSTLTRVAGAMAAGTFWEIIYEYTP